jgi:predicted hotdog family 3-hydroxylacyl-ACP dehydratase
MTDLRLPWLPEELLPHADPMILIDEVTGWDDERLTAIVQIAEDSLYFEPGQGVPAWVGIEYMAQAVAAFAGVRAKAAGEAVRVGFLLGARRYTCHRSHFPLGERLIVRVHREIESVGMGVFQCIIRDQAGETLAEAAINVYQPDDPGPVPEGGQP